MRDPKTLSYSIKRPWPEVYLRRDSPANDARGWFHWQIRILSRRRRYISPFVYVGKYELYFPEIIGIWHTDPRGDAGPPCHGRKYWKLHIHHLSISPSFWYNFVQKHVTKCSWCRKTTNKELGRVSHSNGTGVYHSKCLDESSKYYHAHDPRGCYACSGKSAFAFNRQPNTSNELPIIRPGMPIPQQKALESLHTAVRLKILPYDRALETYNNKKKSARWI